MSCGGSSEKDISVVFEKLFVTSSDQTSSQTKNDSEYPPPVQSQILPGIQKIRKSIPITKNHRSSISASSFDESFQKLDLKIYELNKSVSSELPLLNKKMNSFSKYFNKLVKSKPTKST